MNKKSILLVEDNPDDIDLTIRALMKNNIVAEIDIVTDGAEALDYLFSRGLYSGRKVYIVPHLVLLDIKLPKIDGFTVLRQIRENSITRLIPVVILTTSNEESDIRNGYQLGANSYIRKPVSFERFMDVVKEIGIYWLFINQPPPLSYSKEL
jgi:two-component system response regulator